LAMPLVANIKLKWPDAKISFLTKAKYADMLKTVPALNSVVAFNGVFPTIMAIRKEGYDYVIDIHSNLRSHFISLFSGAKRIFHYRKDSLARRLFVNFRLPSCTLEKHTLDRYFQALDFLKVPRSYQFPQKDAWPGSVEEFVCKKSPKICVIQTAFLGDCALTLPLIEKIKTKVPGSTVCVVAIAETKEIFSSCKYVDKVIVDNKRNSKYFFPEFVALLKKVKKENFDIAVIPHRSLRSALVSFLSGVPVRIGFSKSAGRIFLNRIVPFSWLMHDSDRNLSLFSCLGGYSGSYMSAFPFVEDKEEYDLSQTSLVAVNPGSAWATKRWLKEWYAEIIVKFHNLTGRKTIIIGGPSEVEYNGEVARMAGEERCLDLTGKTSLRQLISVIRRLKLFITNDSGPMHIAAICNVPLIAIFGPTTRELGFFPRGRNFLVLEEELKCRPCALHGSRTCPRKHFLCMRLLVPERVWKEAKRLYRPQRSEM